MAVTKLTAGLAAALTLTIAPAFAQTPTLAPGCTATPAQLEANKMVAVFTFDTFRVRNGKLVELWDGAVINPAAAPGAPGAPAGRGN